MLFWGVVKSLYLTNLKGPKVKAPGFEDLQMWRMSFAEDVLDDVADAALAANPDLHEKLPPEVLPPGGGGVTDHGALTGLADDDHPQYQQEAEKGAASGYASLDATTKVPIAELPTGTTGTTVALGNAAAGLVAAHEGAADPHTVYQKESEKGAASGYASLDGSIKVPIAELPTGTTGTTVALGNAAAGLIATHEAAADPHTGYQKESEKAAASGYASLDAGTKVPTAQLGGAGADGTKFLRGDQTWATPAGSGTFVLTKIAGATGAHAGDETWEVLTAASGNITGQTFVTVMELTNVGVGRYHFKCELIYRTDATTTGINVTATHTGTTTAWIMRASVPTTGGAAATKAATNAAQGAAAGLWETEVELTKGSAIGTLGNFVISVNATTDQIVVIEGSFVVSATGTFRIQLSAELAALVVTAREGSFLSLKQLS